jgi:hypothetical protein
MDNPEVLSTLSTQDTGQINIRENRMGNQEWTICHCLCFVLSLLSLGFLYCLFVLCLVYSMLTVPLDCPFLIAHSVFSNVYMSYVLCTQCWQDLWIVHSWLSPRFSLTFICPLSCVFNVDSVSALSIPDCPLGFLSCTPYTGQINVKENRGDNQEWTIQRHCQHWVHKTQDK